MFRRVCKVGGAIRIVRSSQRTWWRSPRAPTFTLSAPACAHFTGQPQNPAYISARTEHCEERRKWREKIDSLETVQVEDARIQELRQANEALDEELRLMKEENANKHGRQSPW